MHADCAGRQMETEIDYTPSQKGTLLGSFFYGYIVTQIIAGYMARRFGAKWVFGIGVLVTSLATLGFADAARSSFSASIAVRVVQGIGEGVSFPSMHTLLGRWSPPAERSRLSIIAYSGCYAGNVISLIVTGILCSSSLWGGWPSVFYLHGISGCAWCLFWLLLVHDGPDVHPYITLEEKLFIMESLAAEAGRHGHGEDIAAVDNERASLLRPGSGRSTPVAAPGVLRGGDSRRGSAVDGGASPGSMGAGGSLLSSSPSTPVDGIVRPPAAPASGSRVNHGPGAIGGAGPTSGAAGFRAGLDETSMSVQSTQGAFAPLVASRLGVFGDDRLLDGDSFAGKGGDSESCMESWRSMSCGGIPWKPILTSMPVWAVIVGSTAANYGFYNLLTCLPTFLSKVLNFDVEKSGVTAAIPYMCLFVSSNALALAADRLRNGVCSTTFVRKLFTVLNFSLSAGFLLATGYVPQGQTTVAVVYLSIAVAAGGFGTSGANINHLDLSPKYAGILMGLSNTAATVPGFIAPLVTTLVAPDNTAAQWRTVFLICALVYAVGGAFYVLFASGRRQRWANI
jgi:MFS family permease